MLSPLAGGAAAAALFAAPVIAGHNSAPVTVDESYLAGLQKNLNSSDPFTSQSAAMEIAHYIGNTDTGGGKGGQFAQMAQDPRVQAALHSLAILKGNQSYLGSNLRTTRNQL